MAQRFLATNLVQAPTSVLSASSSDPAHPLVWLRDQAPGKSWRSRIGWTFADWNRSGTVTRGGTDYVFSIGAGYYATADEVCTALVAALEAADATPVWAASYSATTNGFSISADLAFAPKCHDDGLAGCWVDLGFSVTANRLAATAQTADAASYQSRQYVAVALPADTAVDGYIMAWAHGEGTTGALYAGSGATVALALANANASPAIATGGASHRIAPVTSGAAFVMVMSHAADPKGYVEVGCLYLGGYVAPAWNWTWTGYQREPQDLSGVEPAVSGAHVRTARRSRNVWTVDWDALLEADMDVLRELKATCPRGKNLWILFDPDDMTDVAYVWLDSGPNERLQGPAAYAPVATFHEVLT